jgi:ribosomal-protein-alanine N-acetyltransferase
MITPTPVNSTIINASPEERIAIEKFLNQDNRTHRHLDWFSPSEWLGQQPFLIEKSGQRIQAALLAAPEVPEATWIRLFSITQALPILEVWGRLFDKTTALLREMQVTRIAALGLSVWFTDLLRNAGFFHESSIVVLAWKNFTSSKSIPTPQVEIRPMKPEDMQAVCKIDHAAFSPLWQNSLGSLSKASQQPGIGTVALKHGEIVGYQISTNLTIHGHLARLAVHPDYQGQQIASALVGDLLEKFTRAGVWYVTVNTQADNKPSLAVYQKFGFQNTGEVIPVFQRVL